MGYLQRCVVSMTVALSTGLVACQPAPAHTPNLKKDIHGMIIGDNQNPGQRLTVGVGDSVATLMRRNPFLKQLQVPAGQELRLPLQTTLDLRYDDGDLKFDVGCVISANVDGNKQYPDAAFIGMTLCEQPVDDWKRAVDIAAEVMRRLEQQNPSVQNLRSFYVNASEAQIQAIGGETWQKSEHDIDKLLTLDEARAKFTAQEQAGHKEILVDERRSSMAFVGVYAGKYAVHRISISKTTLFGGQNLTEAQRRMMRYQVSMAFKLRNDIDVNTLKR